MTTENNKKESEVMEGIRFTLKDSFDKDVFTIHSVVDNTAYVIWPKATRMQQYMISEVKHRFKFGEWIEIPATPPSIEGEIKSKEETLARFIEQFPSDGIMTDEAIKRNVYRAMEAYASQFTASKEKEYREDVDWKQRVDDAVNYIDTLPEDVFDMGDVVYQIRRKLTKAIE